jgi:hypothetical protein
MAGLCMPKIRSVLVRGVAMVLAFSGAFTGDNASRRARALLAGMMTGCCFVWPT